MLENSGKVREMFEAQMMNSGKYINIREFGKRSSLKFAKIGYWGRVLKGGVIYR